jgi:hypothetical protein
LTGERELIDCGRYGDRERFSDPHIGAEIADFITIKIIGQAFGFGNNRIPAITRCEEAGITAFAKVQSVNDAIRRTIMSNTR